jgi:hypothetical protein
MTFVSPINTGRRRRWSSELLPMVCILAVCGAFVMMPIAIAVATWRDHLSLRAEWDIRGPACPEVTKLSIFAIGARPPPPFTYKGTHFAAQVGDVFCEAVPDEGWFPQTTHAVCQFSHPAGIEVTTSRRHVIFEPGMGRRATVSVRNGRPQCVMAGWFED